MPARAALNAYYAWRTHGMERKQREDFDNALYGWTAHNEAANRELFGNTNAPDGGDV